MSGVLSFLDLEVDPDPLLGVDLLLGLGTAQRHAGVASFRETFLKAAHRAEGLRATDQPLPAVLGNTRASSAPAARSTAIRVAVLENTLKAMPDDDSPERALVLATLASELSFGPFSRRRRLADEALAMARRLGPRPLSPAVPVLIDMPLQVPEALTERLKNSAEAVALAEELRPLPMPSSGPRPTGHVDAGQACDFTLARRHLDNMRALSHRLGQPTMQWATTFGEVSDALMTGDPDRAERLATAALEFGGASGQPDAFAIFASQLAWTRFQQGRLGELLDLINQVTERGEPWGAGLQRGSRPWPTSKPASTRRDLGFPREGGEGGVRHFAPRLSLDKRYPPTMPRWPLNSPGARTSTSAVRATFAAS